MLTTIGIPIFDTDGNFMGYQRIKEDIPEHKQAEKMMSEYEEWFRALADSTIVGIFHVDRLGRYTYMNESLSAIFGRTREDCLGLKWQHCIHNNDLKGVVDDLLCSDRNKLKVAIQYRIIRPDGLLRWVRAFSAPIFGTDGLCVGSVGTIIDITERVSAEENIKSISEDLEHRVRERIVHMESLNHMLTNQVEERTRALASDALPIDRSAKREAGSYETLTQREREILYLIARGNQNKEIAKQLFISVRTVETHRAKIMQKLHLQNTAELIHFAVQNKIIKLS
jgi:PAS domain S-box-containing protein